MDAVRYHVTESFTASRIAQGLSPLPGFAIAGYCSANAHEEDELLVGMRYSLLHRAAARIDVYWPFQNMLWHIDTFSALEGQQATSAVAGNLATLYILQLEDFIRLKRIVDETRLEALATTRYVRLVTGQTNV